MAHLIRQELTKIWLIWTHTTKSYFIWKSSGKNETNFLQLTAQHRGLDREIVRSAYSVRRAMQDKQKKDMIGTYGDGTLSKQQF